MSQRVGLCDLCGGELSQGTTSLQMWHDKDLILLRDIPVDKCQQCGQAHITPEISEKIDQFLKEYKQHRPQRYIHVPEFSAEQVLGDFLK